MPFHIWTFDLCGHPNSKSKGLNPVPFIKRILQLLTERRDCWPAGPFRTMTWAEHSSRLRRLSDWGGGCRHARTITTSDFQQKMNRGRDDEIWMDGNGNGNCEWRQGSQSDQIIFLSSLSVIHRSESLPSRSSYTSNLEWESSISVMNSDLSNIFSVSVIPSNYFNFTKGTQKSQTGKSIPFALI